MTPREKAIEAMARAAHDVDWREGHYDQLPNDAPMKAYSRQCATAALDALLAELPGMRLQVVPVVATDEMINAWNDAELPSCVGLSDEESNTAVGSADYAAMCAAAPNVLRKIEP